MSLLGIDVSHWQAPPDLSPYDFLIARAAYGTFADDRFAEHIANARKAGIPTGAYLFGRHGDVDAQVAALLAAIDAVGGVDLVALDWERDGKNTSMTAAEAESFISKVRAVRDNCGLYASASVFPPNAFGADWRWVADYRASTIAAGGPSIPWDLWQFASTNPPLDRSRYRGSRSQLLALGGSAVTTITQNLYAPRPFTTKTGVTSLRRFSATGEVSAITAPYQGSVDADVTIAQSDGRVPHGSGFLRLASGGSAGFYILAGQVDVVVPPAAPDSTPYSQADIDRVVAERSAAVETIKANAIDTLNAAIAAVQKLS